MADINLKGMGVALITPFKEDESVDYDALGRLVAERNRLFGSIRNYRRNSNPH